MDVEVLHRDIDIRAQRRAILAGKWQERGVKTLKKRCMAPHQARVLSGGLEE